MDAQKFLAQFGHVVNAPRGVSQLRQLIYQLAVTGFFTTRVNGQCHTNTLLSEIDSKRRQLIRDKKYKRMIKLEREPIKIPLDITLPSTWRWTRLLDVGEINPRNAEDKEFAAFLPMSGVPQSHGKSIVVEARKWKAIKNGYTHFAVGDVVLAKITPYFENGKAALIENLPGELEIGAGTTEIHVFRPIHKGVLPGYIYLFLRSPLFTLEGIQNMTGTAGQKRLPTDYFATRAFPLPPTEEQFSIVKKVNELMALCDKLEAQQQERRKLQNALRQTTLQAVAAANSPQKLKVSWVRLENNFDQLFSMSEDVFYLRDLVFDLALRGNFLNKDKLVKAKLVSSDSRDYLPRGWKWKTLAELSEYITSGSRGWKAYLTKFGDRFIRSQDIRSDALIFEDPAFVTLPEKVEGKRTLVQPYDLLLTITGGNVGKCAIVSNLPEKSYVSQHVALIRLQEAVLSEFIHYWMINSFGGRAFLAQYIYGDKPGLNLTQVGSVPIPVPPKSVLPEIIASLRQFQQMCDRMSDQLKQKQNISEALATAAIFSITGASIEQKDNSPMKAPQTELIAPIRLGTPPDVKAQAPLATMLAHNNGEMSARDLWQGFGGEIDAFYDQLKTEVAHGWIQEPTKAEVNEKFSDGSGA